MITGEGIRTTVILPVPLYERLKEIADAERRSTHKQIIYALEQFVANEERRAAGEGSGNA